MRVVSGRGSGFESDLQLINKTNNAQVQGRIILTMALSGRRKTTEVLGCSEGHAEVMEQNGANMRNFLFLRGHDWKRYCLDKKINEPQNYFRSYI